jgi:hypothetical protein
MDGRFSHQSGIDLEGQGSLTGSIQMRFRYLSLVFLFGSLLRVWAAAPLEKWVYVSRNLWPEENLPAIQELFRRAAKAGYTHVLLTDSKFAKLGEMDERYFRHVKQLRALANELHLEIVPALFPIGYSNDLLWHDPNLIEGLPVRDSELVVSNGVACTYRTRVEILKGGDFSRLDEWSWHDKTVTQDQGAILIRDPKGENARICQTVKLDPFQLYHLSVRVRTEEFRGTPEVKVLAGNQGLNFASLEVKRTQDWQVHHVVFNSLSNREVNVYLGTWGANSGSLWFDDAKLEKVDFVNLIRRPGAPLIVRRQNGAELGEGRDFDNLVDPNMGNHPWNGAYDVWHEPPLLRTKLPNGTKLRASYYHAITVHDGQANICPSEPKTIELLRDQARRMHAAWEAKGYMMSHDEIRVLNWCKACEDRHLDAGQILAENVRACARILREVNPGGLIYVWSDMFDPNHNAHANYYLVRGNLAGSWEGLDKDVTIVPWYYEKRAESLKFFADRGHRQVIAGYYDSSPRNVLNWLDAAKKVEGVEGVMYTTWENNYRDLETFLGLLHVKNSE